MLTFVNQGEAAVARSVAIRTHFLLPVRVTKAFASSREALAVWNRAAAATTSLNFLNKTQCNVLHQLAQTVIPTLLHTPGHVWSMCIWIMYCSRATHPLQRRPGAGSTHSKRAAWPPAFTGLPLLTGGPNTTSTPVTSCIYFWNVSTTVLIPCAPLALSKNASQIVTVFLCHKGQSTTQHLVLQTEFG